MDRLDRLKAAEALLLRWIMRECSETEDYPYEDTYRFLGLPEQPREQSEKP